MLEEKKTHSCLPTSVHLQLSVTRCSEDTARHRIHTSIHALVSAYSQRTQLILGQLLHPNGSLTTNEWHVP